MNFLVYEHWRPDKNVCFYVGKGKLRRARNVQERNARYGRVVKKLSKLGLRVVIKIIASDLTEDVAFDLERKMIAKWRAIGNDLTNATDGGDGSSGYRFTKPQKAKIRKKVIGRVISIETRVKMSLAHKGSKQSAETRAKQSASAKIAQKKRFEKVKRTSKGRAELSERMRILSRKRFADPNYQEQQRRAALMGREARWPGKTFS